MTPQKIATLIALFRKEAIEAGNPLPSFMDSYFEASFSTINTREELEKWLRLQGGNDKEVSEALSIFDNFEV